MTRHAAIDVVVIAKSNWPMADGLAALAEAASIRVSRWDKHVSSRHCLPQTMFLASTSPPLIC